ncbi:MAG: type I methionyl aminopeptidase, partial [Gemmatimonadota bacterium]
MITLKSPREIDAMGRAGRIVAGTLALMREIVRPGMSTEDLDAAAEAFIRSHEGAVPSFKGLYGFPKTLCTSIDKEIVHGIPSRKAVLHEGSIVSVDVGVLLGGLHADSATTIPVGEVSADAQRLMRVTEESLVAGIAQARIGNHVGDIGHAVQKVAEGAGYGVVRELVGHGIGTKFHEEPQVPNYGAPKRGPRLQAGMTIAIEPMITMGSPLTKTLADKWTIV